MTKKTKYRLPQVVTFFIVGAISSLGYLAAMSLSIEQFGLSVFASALIAFLVGTCISYVGNTLLTFRAKVNRKNLLRFLLVVLLGLALNQTIAYGLSVLGAHYFLIALTVFVLVPIINFLGHTVFTYREKQT